MTWRYKWETIWSLKFKIKHSLWLQRNQNTTEVSGRGRSRNRTRWFRVDWMGDRGAVGKYPLGKDMENFLEWWSGGSNLIQKSRCMGLSHKQTNKKNIGLPKIKGGPSTALHYSWMWGLRKGWAAGGMHETSAWAWCTGKTQRNRVEREVGGGIRMGNTCNSMADSCQYMTKPTEMLWNN